jgi:hypothetical protein
MGNCSQKSEDAKIFNYARTTALFTATNEGSIIFVVDATV